MRVLFATTYLFYNNWAEFTKNKTGFGIMVKDIMETVAEEIDVRFISYVITQGHGKNVAHHTWWDVVRFLRFSDIIRGIKYFFKYPQGIEGSLRYAYYSFNKGFVRQQIKDFKPDIVHIHGIGQGCAPFIEVCEELKVPYVLTLHGLIGLDTTVKACEWDKEMERYFLVNADIKGIPVTVISTGMKRRIEKSYLHHEANNITVICNGSRIPYNKKLVNFDKIDLRKEYGLVNEKIVTIIGPICESKNQMQIVSAIAMGKFPTACHFFFCGTDLSNGEVKRAIEGAGLEDTVHLLGFLPHEKIEQILEQADLNIVASKDEGFGFSIIEAYSYGLPTVAFADLDVVMDLYNCKAMVRVDERDPVALAKGIARGMGSDRDSEWIKGFAQGFSMKILADKYLEEYQACLHQGRIISISKTIDFIHIRKKLGWKILVYVGNFSENKNQIELVKAMKALKDNEKIMAVLAGKESDGGLIRKYVINNKLDKCVCLAGFCSEMDSIWEHADLNVFFSKNDGFGLPVIEAAMRGIPSIVNRELDAYEDVKILPSVTGVEIGDSEYEINAIKHILEKESKNQYDYVDLFSLSKIAGEYIGQYQKILHER